MEGSDGESVKGGMREEGVERYLGLELDLLITGSLLAWEI